jgi:hypothetical protein
LIQIIGTYSRLRKLLNIRSRRPAIKTPLIKTQKIADRRWYIPSSPFKSPALDKEAINLAMLQFLSY